VGLLFVGAAITCYHLTKHLRSTDLMWNLSENESKELMLCWYQKVVNSGELLALKIRAGT